MKKKKNEKIVYKIYDIDDENEICELCVGTLKKCHSEFKQWLLEHLDGIDWEYPTEEDFYKDYPTVKEFIDNPEAWVEKYGDNEADLYSGWIFDYVCTV